MAQEILEEHRSSAIEALKAARECLLAVEDQYGEGPPDSLGKQTLTKIEDVIASISPAHERTKANAPDMGGPEVGLELQNHGHDLAAGPRLVPGSEEVDGLAGRLQVLSGALKPFVAVADELDQRGAGEGYVEVLKWLRPEHFTAVREISHALVRTQPETPAPCSDKLRSLFEAFDDKDWARLNGMLDDSGHGRCFKSTFALVRYILHPSQPEAPPLPPRNDRIGPFAEFPVVRSAAHETAAKEQKIAHEFKAHPSVFYQCRDGLKTFEFRKDDRSGYEVGQTIRLRCYAPETGYSDDPPVDRRITNILRPGEFGLQEGYCILSLAALRTPPTEGGLTAGADTMREEIAEEIRSGLTNPSARGWGSAEGFITLSVSKARAVLSLLSARVTPPAGAGREAQS
jgi:hypothetical protein